MRAKKEIKQFFLKIFARKGLQVAFDTLHWIALRGMNYGAANHPINSGELFFLQYLKKKCGTNLVIFDIGGNVGQFTTLANKVFEGKARIYSFEPTLKAFNNLFQSLKDERNIELFRIGFGSEKGFIEIYYDKAGSVQATAFKDKGKTLQSEIVQITTLDNFCEEMNISHIDFLKIDVEGYELFVLQGAKELIENKKLRYIQFEFGNQQILSKHFLKDFKDILLDFKIYRLLQNGFIEINDNPRYEIFQTSNYIAIRKDIPVNEAVISRCNCSES